MTASFANQGEIAACEERLKREAVAAYRGGDYAVAADILRGFACLSPTNAVGYGNRLATLRRVKIPQEVLLRVCRQTLFADPDASNALTSFLVALTDRDSSLTEELNIFLQRHATDSGVACAYAILLQREGDAEGARVAIQQALVHDPSGSRLYRQLAVGAQDRDHHDAVRNYARSLCAAAVGSEDFVEGARGLAAFLHADGRIREAEAWYRAALCADPDSELAHANFCNALVDLGQPEEAERELRRLLVRWPESRDGLWLSSCLRIGAGDKRGGYQAHHVRWSEPHQGSQAHRFSQMPLWLGQEPLDRDIFVWSDFGIGDEILFAPLASLLARRGARVTLEIDPRLVSLACRSFPEITVRARDGAVVSGYAYHAPSALLARFFFPNGGQDDLLPRWQADPRRVADISTALSRSGTGPFVGFAWGGGGARTSWSKNTRKSEWRPVLDLPGVTFVSLQYSEPAGLDDYHPDNLLKAPVEDLRNDLEGLAALVQALDCVVSISGINAHIAGALRRPGFVLLPKLPLWFWGRSGSRNDWYPSLRLFRRDAALPSPQIAAISEELTSFLGL